MPLSASFPEHILVASLCLFLDMWLVVVWRQSSIKKTHKQTQQHWLLWLLLGLLLIIAFLVLLLHGGLSRSRLIDAFSFIGTLNVFGVLTFGIFGLVYLLLNSMRKESWRESEDAFAGLVGMIAGWIWCYWGIIRPSQFTSQRLLGIFWISAIVYVFAKIIASRLRQRPHQS